MVHEYPPSHRVEIVLSLARRGFHRKGGGKCAPNLDECQYANYCNKFSATYISTTPARYAQGQEKLNRRVQQVFLAAREQFDVSFLDAHRFAFE